MGSLPTPLPTFNVLTDAKPDDTSLPAFMVSTTRGFLPRADPIVTLPPEFDPLESILQRMPVKTASGEPGLLAQGKLGDVVLSELPDLTSHIDKYASNLPLMNALYRDYSFLLSAYLLEPCHLRFLKGEPYGLARDVLPASIARPIKRCADLTNFQPFMEYAGSYALYNYHLVPPSPTPTLPYPYSSLRLIRAFEHGLDPSSSEAGFVLVHIAMVSHSPLLISGVCSALTSASSSPRSRSHFNSSLTSILTALQNVNQSMETMWQKSKPGSYTSFRTFIFGITSQSMFPDGVLYEGIEEYKGKRQSFRGESGANDSMIPLMDNFLAIPMPDTPLTEILKDFRQYRPSNHREFIEWVKNRQEELGMKRWALGEVAAEPTKEAAEPSRAEGSAEPTTEQDEINETKRLWLKLLDQVREFRWRHWCFAREYILKQTSHPTATGGSPIVTWLPNQLGAVLAEMEKVYAADNNNKDHHLGDEIEEIMDLVKRQKETLNKEVKKFCEERGVN